MHQWLADFAYATEIGIWPFVIAGIFVLGIALLTVSYHVFKTATNNPVEALQGIGGRNEHLCLTESLFVIKLVSILL